jgi:DNA-binding NarL/FixJ family response regulator
VDDYKPWHRFILSNLLNCPELQVVGEAYDGWEAVQKSQQLQPDLILLDIGLPTMNGIEAAKQIRRRSPDTRILFCSENRSPDVVREAFRVGAGGYLVKSDAGSDLSSAVTSVIQGKRFVSCTLAAHIFVEPADSGLVRDRGHVVRFYSDDTFFLDELTALFDAALAKDNRWPR